MAGVKTFRDLVAYQRARTLSNMVHRFSKALPREEQYELASQMRRAASSVRLNIAEGFGIGSRPGMLRHLRIARGSLFELDAAIEQITDLQLAVCPQELIALIQECDRVLQGLIRSMETRSATG